MRNFRQAILDIRRAGDWLAARPEVEDHRLGILGVSLGAVVGALAAGVDARFDRCVFLIGGGDLAAIALHVSRELDDVRTRILEKGWTLGELRALWRTYEPLTFASRIRPEATLMFNAESDEVIPRECTLRLKEAIGLDEITWFPGDHQSLAFQAGKFLPRIYDHFRQRSSY